MKKRFWVITLASFIAFALVVGRLLWICIIDGDKYSKKVLAQTQTDTSAVAAKRGDITDRNGVVMATSTIVYNIILDPLVITSEDGRYLDATLELVEKHFGFTKAEVQAQIDAHPESHYVILAKEKTYKEVEGFLTEKDELNQKYTTVAGIFMEESYKRNYAFSTLACNVIGYMEEGKGSAGLEQYYNSYLTGTDGRTYTYVNKENNIETIRRESVNGCRVEMAIDYNIQNIVQTEIHAYLEEIPAKSAAVVIQDPNTGAILAMGDSDDFDLNNPRDMSMHYTAEELDAMSDEEVTAALTTMWRNYCITQNFEPGSTFKPFTLAMGLEEDTVKMDDMYNCWGSLQFLDKIVGCHSEGGHGYIDTWTAIQESCNVGLMEMSQAIGKEDFCRYQRKFGFGAFTDIDLPHEADCNSFLYNDRNMSELDLATNSFGQNFNVTMIQMITGFSSLINGGHLYKPYVTQNIYTAQGEKVLSNDKTLVAETISKTTSETCKQAMRRVVAYGTGTDANVDGYVISGKTGTAEKAGREEGNYLISFIGFAPYDEPQVVCYVTIDEPSTGDAQGISAALFKNIMEKVLPYLNIPTAAEDHDPEGIMTEGPGIVTTEDANAAEENYEEEYYEEEYEENYEEEYNEEN